MDDTASVTTWLGRLKAGDTDAVRHLWDRYFARLVGLARVHLGRLPRRIADEEDVALSAFHSFCQAIDRQQFARLDDRSDLWQVLVTLMYRKVVHYRRHLLRQKRGGIDRQPLDGDDAELALAAVADRDAEPLLAALIVEQFDDLMKQLADDTLRAVAILRLEGHTNDEIAGRLDISRRSVERKLAVIRGLWESHV
jgi:DNA-directed RNA polymerase specialized sigma24 family protein